MPSNGMGTEKKVWEPAHGGWPDDVTPDSKTLVVDEVSEDGKIRIILVPLDQHGQMSPLFETPGANVRDSRLSADGRWIAYESDESGKREVYVSAFPKPAGRLQVSSGGGRLPKWRGDDKELYYIGVGTQVVAAELKTGTGSVEVVRRRPLFQFGHLTSGYDVFPDGRFIIPVPTTDIPVPLSLVLNWTADLKR